MRILRYSLFIFLFFTLNLAFASERLIIEPNAGREPILNAIKKANTSIDVVMYGFTDEQFMNALINAQRTGKKVHILLEPNPYKASNENLFAIKKFKEANLNLQWPDQAFKLTHQKTILIDNHDAIVMTFNLTRSTFKKERNFALIIDDPGMVQEISHVFAADWQHKAISVSHPNLIWSPDNSREKLLDFINNANAEIKIYAQDVSDYQMIGALAKAARQGKSVEILMSNHKDPHNKKLNFLRKAGVQIRFCKNYYIHAKVLIVDQKRAIIGSINLTRPSLNNNRELAVITYDPNVIQKLLKTFNYDWNASEHSFKSRNENNIEQVSKIALREMKRLTKQLAHL